MAVAETATCQISLAEFQRQQEVSTEICESMDALKKRHREWQQAVEVLLANIDSSLNKPVMATAALERGQGRDCRTENDPNEDHQVAKVQQQEAAVIQSAAPSSVLTKSGSRFFSTNEDQQQEAAVQPTGVSSVLTKSASKFYSTLSEDHNKVNGESGLNKLTQHGQRGPIGPLPELLEEVIVDQEQRALEKEDQSEWGKKRRALSAFVESVFFEYLTGIIILINIIMIGIEAEMSLSMNEEMSWATQVEQAFLAVYTVELLLRIAGGGVQTFRSCWFLLDFFLVCVGMLALVVAPMFTGGTDMAGFEKLLVVRGLRLLRLARVLRMVGRFKVVWRLVSGLLTAWDTMLSATGLIMLWLFIFACVAVEIVSKDKELLSNPDTRAIVEYAFGSLPRSILTLVQFVSLDSIAGVYFPLIVAKPWLAIYFMPLMVLIPIGLMNLVTAVLVEHALSHAAREEEIHRMYTKEKIKAALPELQTIFTSLDADGSGQLTRAEAANVPLTVFPPKVLEAVSVDSMADLFEMLDVDQGGSLTQAEFFEGLLHLLLLDVPMWAIQMLKLLRPLRKETIQIGKDLDDLKHFLGYREDVVSM